MSDLSGAPCNKYETCKKHNAIWEVDRFFIFPLRPLQRLDIISGEP